MKSRRRSKHILIADQAHGMPYSKGLMASSLMVSGLPSADAFRIAQRIEENLSKQGVTEVRGEQLRDLAAGYLADINPRYADTYVKWQALEELDVPLIVLLGGVTGVGKSTVATQMAARLGITRVISTDAIREVLRSAFSKELMPTLYESSFNADQAIWFELPDRADRLIIGFQRQVAAVAVGVKALIARAIEEGTDMIIEGAHVVPGFLANDEQLDKAVVISVVMTVQDEDLHRSHFHMRSMETRSSRHEHYLGAFGKIRRLQDHVMELAKARGTPMIDAFDLDSTLEEMISLIVSKSLSIAPIKDVGETAVPRTFAVSESGDVIRQKKMNRLKTWEMLSGRRKSV